MNIQHGQYYTATHVPTQRACIIQQALAFWLPGILKSITFYLASTKPCLANAHAKNAALNLMENHSKSLEQQKIEPSRILKLALTQHQLKPTPEAPQELKMEPSIYKMTPQFSSLSRKTLILFLIEKPKHDWLFLSLSLVLYLHIIAGLSRKEANSTLITLKTILGSFIEAMKMFYPTAFPSKFVRHYHYSKLNQLSIELCVVQNVFCFIPTRILVQHVFTKKPPEAKHANHRFTTKTVNLYVSIQPKAFTPGSKAFFSLWGLDVIAADISDSKKLVQVEQAQNEPTGPSINLESLQEALMDIDEEMQLENNDYGPPVFSEYDLLIIWKVIRLTKLPTWLNCLSLTFGDASAEKQCSPRLQCDTQLMRTKPRENHPEMDPTPNHHMAFHVPKQLRAYGPANFLAAWHFEQINRILQKVPTNKKLTSNLAVLMESSDIPALVSKLGPLFCQQKKLRSLLGDMGNVSGEDIQVQEIETYKTNIRIPKYYTSESSFVNEQQGNFGRTYVPVPTRAKSHKYVKHVGLTFSNQASVGSSILENQVSALGSVNGKETRHFGQILKIL
ncbi:hypothetical protein PSTT_06937, partial [Puccinia striiformis]